MKKIAILAGNTEQYKEHRDIFSSPVNERMFYVNKPEQAYGSRFDEYRIIGSFYERGDALKLEDAVRSRTTMKNNHTKDEQITC